MGRDVRCLGAATFGPFAPDNGTYDVIILAVGHDVFKRLGLEAAQSYGKPAHVFIDVKAVFPKAQGILRILLH
ncbi:MAG: hypothetical protein QM492_08170 [Rhodobacterales bacterium]